MAKKDEKFLAALAEEGQEIESLEIALGSLAEKAKAAGVKFDAQADIEKAIAAAQRLAKVANADVASELATLHAFQRAATAAPPAAAEPKPELKRPRITPSAKPAKPRKKARRK